MKVVSMFDITKQPVVEQLAVEIGQLLRALKNTSALHDQTRYIDLRRRIAVLGVRRQYLERSAGQIASKSSLPCG